MLQRHLKAIFNVRLNWLRINPDAKDPEVVATLAVAILTKSFSIVVLAEDPNIIYDESSSSGTDDPPAGKVP